MHEDIKVEGKGYMLLPYPPSEMHEFAGDFVNPHMEE